MKSRALSRTSSAASLTMPADGRSPRAPDPSAEHHPERLGDAGRTHADAAAATDPRDRPAPAHRPPSGRAEKPPPPRPPAPPHRLDDHKLRSSAARSTTRSKFASRRATSTSTSLSGVSVPVAIEPNSSAKRTLRSVRNAVRSVDRPPRAANVLALAQWQLQLPRCGPAPAQRPRLTARRSVRSFTPTSSASSARAFMCPLCHMHASKSPASHALPDGIVSAAR